MIGTFKNSYSSESDRTVTIQVCGGNYAGQRRSNYTLAVPYSRLSQTIQRIHRTGAKIVGITQQSISPATEGLTTPVQEQQTTPVSSTKIADAPTPEDLTVAAVPTILPESSADFPAIPPLSRGCQKRRRSPLPGILRRKNRKKSRTKTKIYSA